MVLRINPESCMLDKWSTTELHQHILTRETYICRSIKHSCIVSHSVHENPNSLPESRREGCENLMSASMNKVLLACYPGSSSYIVCAVPLYYKSGVRNGCSGDHLTETEPNMFIIWPFRKMCQLLPQGVS